MKAKQCAMLLVVLVVPITVFAQSAPPAAQGASSAPRADTNGGPPDYRIGSEDVLQVLIWKNDAMSRIVPVRPDGKISLPLLNDVQAGGLTPAELRDSLLKKLVEYVPNPEVSVIVMEIHNFKVSVMGEVPKPGRYELKSATTVLDILAQAGGFNQFSARARIFVLRPKGKTMVRVPFNYNKAVSADGEQENFYLQPGDIVVVP